MSTRLHAVFAQLAELHWELYSMQLGSALRLLRAGEEVLAQRVYGFAQAEFELSEKYSRRVLLLGKPEEQDVIVKRDGAEDFSKPRV